MQDAARRLRHVSKSRGRSAGCWGAGLALLWLGLTSARLAGAQAEQVRFSLMTREQGLSHDVVTALAQDRMGFIWIGTEHGLNRWNGYEMTVFRADPESAGSLPGSAVHEVYADRQGRIEAGAEASALGELHDLHAALRAHLAAVRNQARPEPGLAS